MKNGCHVFPMRDGNFLNGLQRKRTIETRYNIRLRRPIEFVIEAVNSA